MESEVAQLSPPPAADFNFDSGCSTPYLSAPSSPARIPNFFNSHDSILVDKLYRKRPSFKDAELEKQGVEREMKRIGVSAGEVDFAFDFGGRVGGQESVFAEELFDGGKIRPLKTDLKFKPPPKSPTPSQELKTEIPRSPSSPLSSRFRSSSSSDYDRAPAPEKTSRSLSLVDQTVSFWDMFPFSKKYRKWKLTDLLFRSASEGRNDLVRNSSLRSNRRTMETVDAVANQNDDVSASNFRSTESGRRRRARSVSAHELHYTLNRAASQESKRRTYLPYKQGLLGCLGFGNPSSANDVVARFGSMTRG